MTNITGLKDYKYSRKLKIITTDLAVIIKIFNLTISALKYYSKYVIVSEMISVLSNNKTILEIQYKKYKKILDEKEETLPSLPPDGVA